MIIIVFGDGSLAAEVSNKNCKNPPSFPSLFGGAFRERHRGVAGGRRRDGSDFVPPFAEGVDAYGQLLTGNVPAKAETPLNTAKIR